MEDIGDVQEAVAADTRRGITAVYRAPYGPRLSCSAGLLRGLALEEFGPVTEPVPYRGRRGVITYWPVATRDQTVVCASLRQWRLALELDFESAWAAFSANPVELRWQTDGQKYRWRPDFIARTSTGRREVLVLKPSGQESLPASRLEVLNDVAQAAGWRVRQVREPSGLRGRNLVWLTGYRFPACGEDGGEQALLEAFGEPTGLRAGVAASGLDPLTGLDLAYRMLWRQQLLFDHSRPLLPDSLAWTVRDAVKGARGADEGSWRRVGGGAVDRGTGALAGTCVGGGGVAGAAGHPDATRRQW
ncbi:TnsA-like heteromeric transposase endonuclease subunit [Streptomyces cavernicola]|uniref:TnsA-like heteromeric transposase endonuclease subunit n=1 Tax=Streptomyces cavernicola TaxID=3043613 RepID=A0ABT6SMU8_9ACTN|nr:TnsA-like heteromeric transposase endonuclease subunit [Streptomyces sp. B-S-A6]MDI3409483.1 TnsA-like heteromeric transposase endonuclease subunit [Streptomyces sp. B-S-A6]